MNLPLGPSPSQNHEDLSRTHAALRRDYFRQFRASLLDPTDDREDVAAAAGWTPGGVEHVYDLLPGRAAGRLRIRAAYFTLAVETAARRTTRRPDSRLHCAADRPFVFMGKFSSAQRQPFVVAVDVFDRFSRSTFLHCFE